MFRKPDCGPVIEAQQRHIEQLEGLVTKLTEQLIESAKTAPAPPVTFGLVPSHMTEDEEVDAWQKRLDGEQGLDFDDPEIKEILEAAGALNPHIVPELDG
jgi:hypothetical protein